MPAFCCPLGGWVTTTRSKSALASPLALSAMTISHRAFPSVFGPQKEPVPFLGRRWCV